MGKLCSCTLLNFCLIQYLQILFVYDGSACCFGLILGCKDYDVMMQSHKFI